jgi:putative transposase
MVRRRTAYDSLVIFLYNSGKEQLLPVEFRKSIPYSTQSVWRNIDYSKYRGAELRKEFEQPLDQAVLYKKYQELKTVHCAITRIFILLYPVIDLVKSAMFKVKAHRALIVDIALRFCPVVDVNRIVKLFRISRATFQRWVLESKVNCSGSFFNWCNKAYPMQLAGREVNKIKQMLLDPGFAHWPVNSLAYYCSREGIIQASLSTWYKIRKLLDIKRTRYKKIIKRKGIVSVRPNEYWHMDVTRFVTDDNMLHYIYLLSDNFSKKILAWRVGLSLRMETAKELIRQAYEEAVFTKEQPPVNLIVDGGTENHNQVVDEFIQSCTGKISKLTALKDIAFSNSPIEAINKILKTYYLPPSGITNTMQLIKRLEWFHEDFNSKRPQHALKGFTPDEVHSGQIPPIDYKNLRKEAMIQRLDINRSNLCEGCQLKK